MRKISMQEVERHNTSDDCWVVINGKVYDLSTFQATHPGGSEIITGNAGKDVSNLFNDVHPKDIVERLLSPDACLGLVDEDTVDPEQHIVAGKQKSPSRSQQQVSAPETADQHQEQQHH